MAVVLTKVVVVMVVVAAVAATLNGDRITTRTTIRAMEAVVVAVVKASITNGTAVAIINKPTLVHFSHHHMAADRSFSQGPQ